MGEAVISCDFEATNSPAKGQRVVEMTSYGELKLADQGLILLLSC